MVSSEGTCQAWFKYRRQPLLRAQPREYSAGEGRQEARV
jgi:hypothetical protein